VNELAADGIPVAVSCRVLKLTRQPYYRWRANPVTVAEVTEAYRANALFDAHRDDPKFGYRYLVEEAREAGEPMAERTGWRICSQHRLWSAFVKKRGKNGKVGPPVHDDLVERDFTAEGPNQLWLSDITEHRTHEGKLYLCAIKDEFSNRIVGYCMASRMKSRLATTALSNAVARRGEAAGCILHTDRGSQFSSRIFVHALGHYEVVGSMGQVGAAGDNAAMETLHASSLHRDRDAGPPAPGLNGRRHTTTPATASLNSINSPTAHGVDFGRICVDTVQPLRLTERCHDPRASWRRSRAEWPACAKSPRACFAAFTTAGSCRTKFARSATIAACMRTAVFRRAMG